MQQLELEPELTRCERCPHGFARIVGHRGDLSSPLVVVGESPGAQEVKAGAPFVGPSGRVLEHALAQHPNITPLFCNAIQCYPGTRTKSQDRVTEATHVCQSRLHNLIKTHPRRVILALGNPAVWSTTNDFRTKITQVRGQRFGSPLADYGVVAAVHPAFLLRGGGSMRQFMADVDLSLRIANHGSSATKRYVIPEIRVVKSRNDLRKLALGISQFPYCAADTETGGYSGFDFLRDSILCAGFCVRPETVYIVPAEFIQYTGEIFRLAHNTKFIWHNGKFDAKFFWSAGVWDCRVDEDTLLLSYCLAPETRILKTDLTWQRIDQLQVGDELIGFNEHNENAVDGNAGTTTKLSNGKPPGGTFGPTKVLSLRRLQAPRYRLVTEQGEVVASAHHMWAARVYGQRWARWISTEKLARLAMEGKQAELFHFVRPWEVDDTREGGYISGILDGEGHLASGWEGCNGDSNWVVGFSQKPGKVLDYTIGLLQSKGYDTNLYKYEGHDATRVVFRGYRETLRVLGAFRPVRLLEKADQVWQGNRKCAPAKILRAEYLGEGEVIGIETTTRTLIAEGFKSHNCIDETKGIHDLEQLASDILGAPDWKYMIAQYVKGKKGATYADIPPPILYDYMAKDISGTLQVFSFLRNQVRLDPNLEKLYTRTLLPQSLYMARIEYKGIAPDQTQTKANQVRLQADADRLEADFQRHAAPYAPSINPRSPKQVSPFLYESLALRDRRRPNRIPESTDEDTLRNLIPSHPAVTTLLAYRKVQKALGTYVNPAQDSIGADGRVHTSYLIHGTTTGRPSSNDPNLLNIPREPSLRSQYAAAPNHILMEVDLNQAELRVLAELSKDRMLHSIYTVPNHPSIHDVTRIDFFGDPHTYAPSDWERYGARFNTTDPKLIIHEQKMRAKGVNFGIVYGRTAESVAEEYLIPVREATGWIQRWFAKYEGAGIFINRCRSAPLRGENLVTPFGFKRRFQLVSPEKAHDMQNQAANFPEQSIAWHLTLHTGLHIQEVARYEYGAYIVNTVYDSILFELPDDRAGAFELGCRVLNLLAEIPRRWGLTHIPFRGDIKLGRSWGHLEEVGIPQEIQHHVQTVYPLGIRPKDFTG